MAETRRLAVIMFTDIEGYTALMQHDESTALLKLHRYKNLVSGKVADFNGEIIQYYGDGALVIFTNSIDAVNCAKSLQESFYEEPRVPVRIGINLGDIIYDDGNIFGDCVNITSRIESMGNAGTILISESVQQQIKNQLSYNLTSLGSFDLKNVEEPMEIFSLDMSNNVFASGGPIKKSPKESRRIKSIAVLPFVNMSNDADQEYFSDGMAEEIINSLSHLKDLHVAGRTSSFQFKGTKADLREVGKKLNVDNVLEGSVRKQGNRLRITAQLISVDDGYHLWSERYDRNINDLFAIQDEIALVITEKLRVTLIPEDRKKISRSPTSDNEAYELYLKGKSFVSRRGNFIKAAIDCFSNAIALDPSFALAYSALADADMLVATYGILPPGQVMVKGKRSAERALELDPLLCEPYCALGYYYASYEWNWPEAKKNFLRAIELNPKYAEGHFRYAWNYLGCIEGNFVEAEAHCAIAIRLEPLSSICYATYSLVLYAAGKFEEALAACKTGFDLDPHSFVCQVNAGRILMALNRHEEAVSTLQHCMQVFNRHQFVLNALTWAYCTTGNTAEAVKLVEELKHRSKTEYITKTFCAFTSALLGDNEEAFEYLERAFEERDPTLIMMKYVPWVPSVLTSDKRFGELMKRIGM